MPLEMFCFTFENSLLKGFSKSFMLAEISLCCETPNFGIGLVSLTKKTKI